VTVRIRSTLSVVGLSVLMISGGCRSHAGLPDGLHPLPIDVPTESVRLPEPFIRLDRAVSFDVSANGIIHVLVNDPASVRMFTQDGRSAGSLGGPGTRAGAFSDPTDVVATALFVTVADRGNGRIQRFGSDGGLVEVIPLDAGSDVLRPYFTQNSESGGAGTSRPEAVVETPSGGLVVVDSRSGRVLLVDRLRERVEVSGQGEIHAPLDLALFGRQVIVLDHATRSHQDGSPGNRLVVLDALGSMMRTVHTLELRSLSAHTEGLLGSTECGFVSFSASHAPVVAIDFSGDTPDIIGVMRADSDVLVLTSAGVHRLPAPVRWFRPVD